MKRGFQSAIVTVTLAALFIGFAAAPAFALGEPVFTVSPPTGENTNADITLTFTGTGMSATDCISSCSATLHNANGTNINGTSFTPGTTSATAHFNLTGATLGTWDVRVTNLSGTGVCSGCFTVTAANPSGITVSPSQVGQGATGVAMTITGSNFQSGANVTFSNPAIGLDSKTFINSGEIDVVIHVSSTGAGTSTVTITNPDLSAGTSTCPGGPGPTGCITINAKPTIVSSSPSSAANTGPVTLTLTGSSFEATGTAKLTKTGQSNIVGTNWTRNTANSLSIDFDITDVAPGPWVISIVNGDGGAGSCANCLTVTAAAPTVASTSPDHKPQGVTTNVSVIGTNFFPGAVASFSGTGITVNSTTFVDTSHVTANITITPTATVGSRNVTVTNTDSQADTCTGCFSVTLPAPAITSVSPTSGHQGTTIDVTVTGANFVNGAGLAVTFSGTGITVNSTTFNSATQVTANITISPSATVSSRDVTLTNPDAQSDTCVGCFDVRLPAPTATSVSPTSGHRSTTIDVIVTGTNFVNGAVASFSGTGITVNSTTFTDASHVTANITISSSAALSSRDVTVTNPDTQAATCPGCFTVILPAPTATSVSPTTGEAGTTLDVTVTGTNFVSGATVSFSGTGITVNSTTFTDSSHVKANITISPSATPGARNVSVTNPDTQSATCGGCFTVTAAVTATLTTPTTLTDPIVETFSRDVGGVTTSNFVFGVTGSGTTLAGTLACKDVSSVSTSCGGSTVRSAWLTPTAHLLPGQHYTVTLNPAGTPSDITDSNGAAIPTITGTFRASRVEQETSLAESYRWRVVPASGALGGSFATEHLAGATATFTFSGTSVRWYTVRGPNQGDARVFIDGVSWGRVDNYHRSTFVYGSFWTFSPLTPGAHTMVIIVDGLKGSPIGTGTYVSVDGMQVDGGTVQSTPSITYRWRTAPSATAFGGHYAISDVQGASTYFSFRGTRIDWYTILGPSGGRAAVYIDGNGRHVPLFDDQRQSHLQQPKRHRSYDPRLGPGNEVRSLTRHERDHR
jgi:hypothetical protein